MIIVNIHPMLLMDEKAKIFRKLTWFILMILLITREIIIKETMKLFIIELNINNTIGIIFCQVIIINAFIHVNPSMISGNQKWKGAIPILINKAEFITIRYLVGVPRLLVNKDSFNITIIDIKITDDAIAWVIKYLIDDSDDKMLFFLYINGIIDRRLISSPIHIPSQE